METRPESLGENYLKVKKLQLTHHIFIETENRSYISTTVTIIRCKPYLQIKKKKLFLPQYFQIKLESLFLEINTKSPSQVICL